MAGDALFSFRVTGVEQQKTALPSRVHEFDETYEIEGEHPAEALAKLLQEIEWGILDSDQEFAIEFIPTEPVDA